MDDSATGGKKKSRFRGWAVDAAFFLFAMAYSLVLAALRPEGEDASGPEWLLTLDQVAGVASCAALWWRRRRPVEIAFVLILLSAFLELVSGAMLVALLTVAMHRPPRTTARLFGLSVVTAFVYAVARPEPDAPPPLLFVLGVTVQGAVVGWGLFLHHQRQLVVRAEEEARLRAEQAQYRARAAVAREMHDVLGHRLSMLSLYAGALEYGARSSPEEVARAAEVIRESAHRALQDLREIVGVLRAPDAGLPQPTLADLRGLVSESARAGMRVALVDGTGGSAPATAVSTAYRVVQEALTNVRKHAPGARVEVSLTGGPGEGLTVAVHNSADGGAARRDGTGFGLLGLRERVELVNGRLDHGFADDGGWRVSAWLPWPA